MQCRCDKCFHRGGGGGRHNFVPKNGRVARMESSSAARLILFLSKLIIFRGNVILNVFKVVQFHQIIPN